MRLLAKVLHAPRRRTLLSSRRGAAGPEYALLLLIASLAALLGAIYLGQSVRGTFSSAAEMLANMTSPSLAVEQEEPAAPARPAMFVYDTSLISGTTISIGFGEGRGGLAIVEINWGDGTVENYTGGMASHTYATDGIYQVSFSGDAYDLGAGEGDLAMMPAGIRETNPALVEIRDFGTLPWMDFTMAFAKTDNLTSIPENLPATVTSLEMAFRESGSNLPQIASWDVSNVTNFDALFWQAPNFNQPIGSWDITGTTSLTDIFRDATSFNQPLNDWDTSRVSRFGGTFREASSFNQPLDQWDMTSATTVYAMFHWATSFNQDISGWQFTQPDRDHSAMFDHAYSFNQPIDSWNMSGATNIIAMFRQAYSFNQDLNSWDISGVDSLSNLFYRATIFNGDISAWNTANVLRFDNAFNGAGRFNRDISGWNTSSAFSMGSMFREALDFNQDISGWDVSGVSNFTVMFYNAVDFTQDLSAWRTDSGVAFHYMFYSVPVNFSMAGWDFSNLDRNYMSAFIYRSGFDGPNTDILVQRLDASGVTGSLVYIDRDLLSASGQAAVANLEAKGWTVVDYNPKQGW